MEVVCSEDGIIQEIQWQPEGMLIPQRSPIEHVEILPHLIAKPAKLKTGKLSLADRKEIRMRCGSYISAKLGDHDSLGDAEIILGAWILHRPTKLGSSKKGLWNLDPA